MNYISKKQKVFKELWENSNLFKRMVTLLGGVFFIVADYAFVLVEKTFWGMEQELDSPSALCIMFLNLVIVLLILSVFKILFMCLLCIRPNILNLSRTFHRELRKIKAIRNSCFIPCTKEELDKLAITSIEEYFKYISERLYYGSSYSYSKSHDDYVDMNLETFRKVLLTCASVFGVKSVFSLFQEDCLIATVAYLCTCCSLIYRSELISFLSEYQHALDESEILEGSEDVRMSADGSYLQLSYILQTDEAEKKYIKI